jgi:transposase
MAGEESITMAELNRYEVIKSLLDGRLINKEAGRSLQLSVRQIQRIKKRVFAKGVRGVFHGNKGRKPVHAFSAGFKAEVLDLFRRKYFDFNFSHLSEYLLDAEAIKIGRETLRKWLRAAGLGGKKHRQPAHRKRRIRCGKKGQMLFLDGSPHVWFGHVQSTLILCTDDATGEPLYGQFRPQEDLDGCFLVCGHVFKRYGLPGCFYLDKASQFTTTRHGGIHYIVHTTNKFTQFERAMKELSVGTIFADSPQARGRGERINGSFQDRLVAEMRVKGIDSFQAANRYLNQIFITKYGRRFGVQPREKTSAWRKMPAQIDLRNILCRRYLRTVNNDNTISVDGQIIQLMPTAGHLHLVKAKVIVNLWLDGSWHIYHPKAGEVPCKLFDLSLKKLSALG